MKSTIYIKAYDDKQAEEIYELLKPFEAEYTQDVTGDACKGDEIVFAEAVFSGSYKRPKFDRFDIIQGTIVRDSYGADKQQHTFSIQTAQGLITRKGRNVYKHGTFAKIRGNREQDLKEKHGRGNLAREQKARRIYESFV